MAYAVQIGLRYLRSKKRQNLSVITGVAITGVALGVGALLAVLSITSGFQDEFRNKVLGVNAHVLVLKYGLDFEEYRDVIDTANRMPEVAASAPFVINEMMIAKGDNIAGILVKGIDPETSPRVLDLPHQIVDGTLDGLRLGSAGPPTRPGDRLFEGTDDNLDQMLQRLRDWDGGSSPPEAPDEEMSPEEVDALIDRVVAGEALVDEDAGAGDALEEALDAPAPSTGEGETPPAAPLDAVVDVDTLPEVDVPTPEEMEAALAELEQDSLPDDAQEQAAFEQEAADAGEAETATAALPGIVVGKTLAENLGLAVGDRVKVISPLAGLDVSLWAAKPKTPRSRDFRVISIFEAGFQEYDTRLVYVDLYEAQTFFDQGDSVTGVEIRLHNLEQAPVVSRQLARALGEGPFHTRDWKELNHNLFTALEIQKIMLSLVIATIIFVAAFNVIATLIMVVLEKKREIAILKAMGAKDHDVLGIFLVQGTIIGLIGTAIGLVLGGGVVAYLSTYRFPLDPKVYLIDHLPVRTSPMEFVLTVLIALAICISATLIPSWWAARMLPAEGVRQQ